MPKHVDGNEDDLIAARERQSVKQLHHFGANPAIQHNRSKKAGSNGKRERLSPVTYSTTLQNTSSLIARETAAESMLFLLAAGNLSA